LIWLIVSHSLTQQQSSWEELIAIIDGGLTTPSPKHKHATSTPEHLEKCRELSKQKNATSTSKHLEKHKELAKHKHATGTLE